MLTPDWLLLNFALRDCGIDSGDVVMAGNHLEGFTCGMVSSVGFLSFIHAVHLQYSTVIKVFDWLVVVWQVYEFVN